MAELTGADGDQRRIVVLPVTCCRDGREHLVAEEAIVPANAGRYTAILWPSRTRCGAGLPCGSAMPVLPRGAQRRPAPKAANLPHRAARGVGTAHQPTEPDSVYPEENSWKERGPWVSTTQPGAVRATADLPHVDGFGIAMWDAAFNVHLNRNARHQCLHELDLMNQL